MEPKSAHSPHSTQTGSAFAPTHWTLVRRSRGRTPEARAALAELCAAYYQPVFRFLHREGRIEDAARELAQEFFAHVLSGGGLGGAAPAKGRFRSFLLGAVKHFLADRRDRERAAKRGLGLAPESLDAPPPGEMDTAPGLEIADASALPPDSVFDRAWALAIIDRALAALRREFEAVGRGAHFAILKAWLAGGELALSQSDAARQLGLSAGAVKVAVHRLRKRFRELVRAEIAQTVGDNADVDAELRYLVEVLAQA